MPEHPGRHRRPWYEYTWPAISTLTVLGIAYYNWPVATVLVAIGILYCLMRR